MDSAFIRLRQPTSQTCIIAARTNWIFYEELAPRKCSPRSDVGGSSDNSMSSGLPGKVDYSYDTCLPGLPPDTASTSRLSLVSQIAVVWVSAHPLLSSSVLHNPLVLSRSDWPYADLGVGVLGAQLFRLHFLATLKSAAESQVDVALV